MFWNDTSHGSADTHYLPRCLLNPFLGLRPELNSSASSGAAVRQKMVGLQISCGLVSYHMSASRTSTLEIVHKTGRTIIHSPRMPILRSPQ